ncbi:hypothetical protein M405DRAFT_863426 [Rhizopogon salebrosus TDB-379]|nr:hypothetical protein M405DRAFT_863426 [Rhizopogon salebrosus TDB-379]
MADEDTNLKVQQFLDALPVQSAGTRVSFPIEFFGSVNAICDISSSSHPRRELVFQGLLTMRRFSQLSLLTGQLDQLIRIDPFGVLPCVLSLKVLVHLGATSLCRAAQSSSQPLSKRILNFKFVSGRPMKRLEVEFVAYAQSHSYDIPLVSQPSMSSSSSSSQLRPTLGLLTPSLNFPDVEPVTRPWKDVYSECSTVERSWRRGRYPVRTLRGHTDGVRVSSLARRSSTLPSISSSSTPATAPYMCGTSRWLRSALPAQTYTRCAGIIVRRG